MTDPQAIFANLSGGGDEVTFETATRYIRDQHGVHTAQLSDEQLERMLDQADEDGAGALDEAAFTQFVEAVDAAAATPEDDPFAAPSGQAVPDSTEAAESMFAAGGGVDDGDDGADMFGGMDTGADAPADAGAADRAIPGFGEVEQSTNVLTQARAEQRARAEEADEEERKLKQERRERAEEELDQFQERRSSDLHKAAMHNKDADSELQKRLEEKPDRSWEHVLSLVDVSGSPADKVQRDVSRMRKLLLKLREAEQKNAPVPAGSA